MKTIKLTVLSFIFLFYVFLNSSIAQWVQVGLHRVRSMASGNSTIFVGTSDSGVYLSTNNGTNWTHTSLNNRNVTSLGIISMNIFAGTTSFAAPTGVYLSTNNGATWTQTSLNNRNVFSLTVNGNYIFAGTETYGVYVSTNNGINWTQTSLNNRTVHDTEGGGTDSIYAGTDSTGVYLSTNNGATWTQSSLNNRWVYSLGIISMNIFAGTRCVFPNCGGVYLSTNNGTTWTQTSLNNRTVRALGLVGPNSIFAGTDSFGVYVSTNLGTSWIQRNEGLGDLRVTALLILNNYIFAGTPDNSVYRRPLSELVGIQPISADIPNQFSLSQNYPNPFNPTTKIRFSLPKSSFATLVIYDILGREVQAIVNEQLNAGTYEADWNADKFSSEVYYYKLTAGDYTETKKMVLMK